MLKPDLGPQSLVRRGLATCDLAWPHASAGLPSSCILFLYEKDGFSIPWRLRPFPFSLASWFSTPVSVRLLGTVVESQLQPAQGKDMADSCNCLLFGGPSPSTRTRASSLGCSVLISTGTKASPCAGRFSCTVVGGLLCQGDLLTSLCCGCRYPEAYHPSCGGPWYDPPTGRACSVRGSWGPENSSLPPPSGPCFCFALQARVRKFGAKLLQLLAEWTETFPRDFEEESTIGHLTDVVGRIAPCDEVGQPGWKSLPFLYLPIQDLSPSPASSGLLSPHTA